MDSFVPSRNSCIYILSLSCPLLSCSFLFLLLRFVLGESLRFTIFRNSSLPLSSLGRDVVLRKEVLVVRHGLEFQVVPGGVLEEHRVLLPRLPFEPQVGLDDEFHPVGAHPLGQVLELLDGVQRESGVRHGDLVPVDGVVVIDAPVVVSGPVADDLVAVEGIILPLVGGPALLAPQDGPIKFLCRLEGMDGKGIVEGIPGGRGAPCFVLRCRCCCCCCCCVCCVGRRIEASGPPDRLWSECGGSGRSKSRNPRGNTGGSEETEEHGGRRCGEKNELHGSLVV
mmetsp:Transcript_16425/g.37721  ORF Transcript_16425/g.37721 Transcript_16425/m.37721 type:complete len:282 (+) Transcript_16425:2565-3410(+)